jgi:N-glycosylase/DNA lyase
MLNSQKEIISYYNVHKEKINHQLDHFQSVPTEKYFYELCYCLCTPMSKAENAQKVQLILEKSEYYNKDLEISEILRNPDNYIRFHNQKAKHIENAKKNYSEILQIIISAENNFEKREKLVKFVPGMGYKEASHFLRNIGLFGLAILDRHILRNLAKYNVIQEIPKTINSKKYVQLEQLFINFANSIGLSLEKLDLTLWAKETGFVLK